MIRLLPLVLALCVGYEFLAFNLPFRAVWLELPCVATGVVVSGATFWLTGITFSDEQLAAKDVRCSSFLVVPFLPLVLFTSVGRVSHAQQLAQPFDGIVLESYRSRNHNARTIVVSRSDGGTTSREGVDPAMWSAVSPGRSHLKKPAWSAFGEMDGKTVRVGGKGYVFLFGPFRD